MSKESEVSEASEEFVWRVHEYTCSFIQFADTKAVIAFGWCGGLLAWLCTQNNAIEFFTLDLWQKDWKVALAMCATVVELAVSALAAVMVISPFQAFEIVNSSFKSAFGRKKESSLEADDLVYWRSIRRRSCQQYVDAVNAKSTQERAVAKHVYTLAGIAERKYQRLSFAIWGSVIGTILSILAVTMRS